MALDKIIAKEVGESSNMRSRLTKLDAQLKAQMNRIIEHRTDGLTFHYKAIDQVRADGQQLVNQAMGGILQDSINEMGAKAVLKGGGNPLQGVMGSLGGLQEKDFQQFGKDQEKDFQQFGKDVCSRVVTLEDSRKALVGSLK
ncbi:Putative periplasmic protein [Salmonella enterica subsp. enterica serovar Montevideo str. S5-403]|uniref:Putative periplasmic protein n=1 Tax=Salmonella enterica subsp. enterica serovar Montevideo str. S5-403 TaxID=913242 RepID=G5Q7N9_SALMO|nr:Putative periplasmic protein [Salmonella enterica subsp. enterica serovar Montevideo str. S5-403]